jgi:hypothetical protein
MINTEASCERVESVDTEVSLTTNNTWVNVGKFIFRGFCINNMNLYYLAHMTGDTPGFTLRVYDYTNNTTLATVNSTNTTSGAIQSSAYGCFTSTPRYKSVIGVDIRKDGGSTGLVNFKHVTIYSNT